MPIRKRSGEVFTIHCPLLSCNKSGTTTGRRTDRWQWQHQWIGDRPQGLVPVPTTTFWTINNNLMVPAGDASNLGRSGETFLFLCSAHLLSSAITPQDTSGIHEKLILRSDLLPMHTQFFNVGSSESDIESRYDRLNNLLNIKELGMHRQKVAPQDELFVDA